MRSSYVKTLYNLAKEDDRIYSVLADIGVFIFDKFAEDFKGRLINCGIAEQNMIGVCAGLALSGKIPFAYSIAPFATLRCLEQIRIDVCYQNLNVKIVGVGGGLSYGILGATHHLIEDIAILRALPNMTVIAPAGPREVEKATIAAVKHNGPVYLRLAHDNDPVVYTEDYDFEIGKAIKLKEGKDMTLISTGSMTYYALEVAKRLEKDGLSIGVLNMHTIKPIDEAAIIKEAQNTGVIFTVEEHSIIGGLGGAVSEVLMEKCDNKVKFKRLGIGDYFCNCTGDRDYLRHHCGISAEKIEEEIKKFFNK